MACQTPSVISKFAGLVENLRPGTDCLAVDPNNTGQYAEAILKLLSDKATMRECAESGCMTVREEFSWEAIAKRFVKFYAKNLEV